MPDVPTIFPEEPDTFLTAKDEHSSSGSMAPSLPLQPSMAYLAVARSLSVRAAFPHPRKLLILDLNGTLLFRPKTRNSKQRPIHPRPYMPSFCSYIFHETVKPWLEVMVWSSARPHNVDNMVTRSFGNRRDQLKAIWARDMLGLEKENYIRKVQTVKNLERCWSALSDSLPSHTAETTLLVDDSARKAHLQPYNHLCVPEYTKNIRNQDLLVKETLTQSPEIRATQVAEQVHLILSGGLSCLLNDDSKRLTHKVNSGFDPTLIAVIGILDEIKEQTNVAGYIRAGGLWAGQEPPSTFTMSAPLSRLRASNVDHSSPFELLSGYEQGGHQRTLSSDRRGRTKLEPDETAHTPPSTPDSHVETAQEDPVWFDHLPCFQYWIDRGTRVTKGLGIELHHGILR